MNKITISTQKKFLYIPFNFHIIFIFACLNTRYLKAEGVDLGWFNIKFIFNMLFKAFPIVTIFAACMFILNYLNVSQVALTILTVIGMYLSMTVISWRFIKYQKKLGIEE